MQVKCKAVVDGIAWFKVDDEWSATLQVLGGENYYFVTMTITGNETFVCHEHGKDYPVPTPPAGELTVKLPEETFNKIFNIL